MATDNWNGSGDWNGTPADWSLGKPPAATDNAEIQTGTDTLTTTGTAAAITIDSGAVLSLTGAAVLTTSGSLTVANGGRFKVDTYGGSGGSAVTIGGNLVNGNYDSFGDGGVSVGTGGMTAADSLTVKGTFTNTGGTLNVTGGQKAGATATLAITGAAPATLTGNYLITGNVGGAAVRWGSGGITQIGDGASNAADLYIDGADAFVEIGATNSNSALSTLTTIASNGLIDLRDGAQVTTAKGVTISGGGRLKVDTYGGSGGSAVTIGGNLVNGNYNSFGDGGVSVGTGGMTAADSLTVKGTFTNTGGTLNVNGGQKAGATATLAISGAAPATLTGNYLITGNVGGAAVRWGSGGITQIGDGASNAADLQIDGADAFVEIGATNSNSALSTLTTIASNGLIDLRDGAQVTTAKGVTISGGGRLKVDTYGGSGGSAVTIGGNLVNGNYNSFGDGGVSVGTGGMTAADSLTVKGTFTNTGGTLNVNGGQKAGATATLAISGAAPATLTGNYLITGNVGGAAVRWGSGGITQIGDGASNAADLQIDGADAFVEIGATNSNSALSTLTTIASNGLIDLRDGAQVTTAKGVTISGGGRLKVDTYGGSGGSAVTIGGNLVNGNYNSFGDGGVSVGTGGMTAADSLTVKGTFTNTGGTLNVNGGQKAGATATLAITGAAPATLTGNYLITGNVGGAAVRWGSGGITQIGDGASNAADLQIDGADAFVEIGATNSNSALSTLTTIASNGLIDLRDGAQVTTAKGVTISGGGRLKVDTYGGSGGSAVTIGGNLVNGNYNSFGDGGVSVGTGGMTAADSLTVKGTFTNTGGTLNVNGGQKAGATATLAITGAAPATLTGNYLITGNAGGAAVRWGSGGITQIGDGASNAADLQIDGADAFVEIGATNSNSALSTLTTIASNGLIDLRDGAQVTTAKGVTIANGGRFKVDTYGGSGGSAVTIGGNLVNGNYNSFGDGGVSVGTGGMTAADSLTVKGTFTNTGGTLNVNGGQKAGATATLAITGAVPATLTGNYLITGNVGGAVVRWGSGGITKIGDGASNAADLYIDGADALAEVGTAGSDNAVAGLTTIANNGELDLRDGTVVSLSKLSSDAGLLNFESGEKVTIGGSLNLQPSGRLKVDAYDNDRGGSTVTIGGNLVNGTYNSFGDGGIGVGNVNITAASTLTVTGTLANPGLVNIGGDATASATMTVAGGVTNTGTIDIAADGKLAVTGGKSYVQTAGLTTVDGNLSAANIDVTGGVLDPAGTISGNVTLGASSTYDVAIAGAGAGQIQALNLTGGTVALQGGTLQLDFNNGFTPAAGESFTIATFAPGSLTGTFGAIDSGADVGSVNQINIAGGLTLDVIYDNAGGDIRAAVVNSPVADGWKAATGVWSNANEWSAGEPAAGSDVTIGTANGDVRLDVNATVADLTVKTANTLEVDGGTALDVTGGVATTGNLRIDPGASLEIGGAASGTITFNGIGGTLRFDAPSSVSASIANFTAGDEIILTNANAVSASVSGKTLTVGLAGGGSLAYTLTGTTDASGYNIVKVGSDSEITGKSPVVLSAPKTETVVATMATSLQPLSLTDPEAGGGMMTVTLTAKAGTLGAAVAGHGTVTGTGTKTLTLKGTLGDINTELSSVTYDGATPGNDTVAIAVTDPLGATTSADVAITIQAPPSATQPVINAPFAALTIPNQQSGIGGISINDPAAEASGEKITLTLTSGGGDAGALTVTGSGGAVSGNGTDNVTITGTVQQVNSYLSDGLTEDILQDAYNKAKKVADEVSETYGKAWGLFFSLATGAIAEGLGGAGEELGKFFLDQAAEATGNPTPPNLGGILLSVDAGLYSFAANVLNDVAALAAGATELPPPAGEGGGDAHILTYSNVLYQLDAVGDFLLTGSTSPSDSFTVEVRLTALNNSSSASVITQVGAQVGTDTVTIGTGRASTVMVDGKAVSLTLGAADQLSGGSVTELSANTFQISWNTGEVVTVTDYGNYLNVKVGLASNDTPGSLLGLMGPDNGAANDFTLPDGTVAPVTTTADLYAFADIYRLAPQVSILDGAGPTDTSFPTAPLTLADFPAAAVAAAAQVVAAAGITDPGAAAAAEFDYLISGGDPSFVASDQSLFQGITTTPAAITPPAPVATVGVIAAEAEVNVNPSGETAVTFDVDLSLAQKTDTQIGFAVIAPNSADLGAAAFGGTVPSGTVTIKAGQTTGQFTVEVSKGALGKLPSADVAVQITAPAGVPVYATTATATVTTPQAGNPPVPELTYATDFGTFINDGGGNYTLDLGPVQYGQRLPTLQFGVENGATAPADEVAGTFSVDPVEGFTVTGAALPAALAAGQSYDGLSATIDTIKFGDNSETITFNPVDTNGTGFSKPLSPLTLTITDTLELPNVTYSQAWGDVHIVTYNGLTYNFQAIGDYTLAQSHLPGDTFDIEMDLEPWYTGASVTTIHQVAITLGADTVTFDWARTGPGSADPVWIDHNAQAFTAGETMTLAGGTITEVSPDVFKVDWSTGETMTVTSGGSYINIVDGIPPGDLAGGVAGLQGEAEGTSNDFQLSDGTVLPQPLTTDELYGEYRESWEAPATNFDGSQPAPNGPPQALTLADFPANLVAQAAALVAAAGITDPNLAQEAELDYLATGDTSFISSTAAAQQAINVVTSTAPVTAPPPPPPEIGVMAEATKVTEVAGKATVATFTAYLTSKQATATDVHYAVVAPGAGFLGAAAFGGTLPSGDVTIAANSVSATFQISVPAGALGKLPNDNLEVQVSSGPKNTTPVPVLVQLAQTEIVNNQPEPGSPPLPEFSEVSGGGTFTFDATTNTYTLDLGSLTQGAAAPNVQIALDNAALAGADSLGGTFTPPLGSGFGVTGATLAAPVAAGQAYTGLELSVPTGTLGSNTMTLSFNPTDVNASGYSASLGASEKITLVVEDTISVAAGAGLNTPSTIVFPNVRVGTAESQHVSISNTAGAPAASLDVTPYGNGDATATGQVSLLAPGAMNSTALTVGLDTGAAGARSGTVALAAQSDAGQGNTSPILPSPAVDVFGSVYRVATGSVAPLDLFVHVGAAGTAALSVSNTDPVDGFSESLIAQLTKTTGGIAIASTGPSPDIAAGKTDPGPLQISFSTAKAGTITGTATMAMTSDGGTGANSIDGLGTLALAPQTVDVTVTVQGFAQAAIEKASGAGTLTQSGTSYTLNLGTVKEGGTALSVDLGVSNIAAAPSDSLSGSFKTSGASEYTLSGFTAGVANIAAGGAQTGLDVTLGTATAGVFTETITLTPTSVNTSNSTALPVETLTITGTVAGQPVIAVPGPLLVQQGQSSTVKGVSVAEPGAPASESFTVVVADTNGVLSATTAVTGGGGTITSGTGDHSLTIAGTLAQVNADLTSLGIQDGVDAGDTVTVNATDAAGGHAAQKTIAVAVNAPPAVTAPATAIVQPNQASPVPGITVADPNAVSAGETITATVSDGAGLLSASTTGPGGGGAITGAGTTRLTVTGTLAQVNADLAGLTDAVNALVGLQPEPGSPMPVDQLAVSASDSRGGNAGPQTVTIDLSSQTSEEIAGPSLQMAIFSAFGLGTLKLDDSQAYTGQVFGFAAGDVIDLADIGFGAKTTLGFAENGAGTAGTLTIDDGTHTAALTLLTSYMASSFVTASDGHGGTLVGYNDPAELQNLAIASLHG